MGCDLERPHGESGVLCVCVRPVVAHVVGELLIYSCNVFL